MLDWAMFSLNQYYAFCISMHPNHLLLAEALLPGTCGAGTMSHGLGAATAKLGCIVALQLNYPLNTLLSSLLCSVAAATMSRGFSLLRGQLQGACSSSSLSNRHCVRPTLAAGSSHLAHWPGCAGPQLLATQPAGAQQLHSSPRPRRLSILCMAHPRRVAKVASQIQREISDMLIRDDVLVKAVTPERAGGATELSALASVTHVYVSNDLQVVKVYISIYSDERGKQKAMNNLKRLEWYVRREMGQRVPLRLTPEYRIEYDDSVEEADLVERVIGREDVQRFSQELAREEAAARGLPWPAQQTDTKQAEGHLADDEAEDDDGFFADYRRQDAAARAAAQPFRGPFDDLFEPQPRRTIQRGGSQQRGDRQYKGKPRTSSK